MYKSDEYKNSEEEYKETLEYNNQLEQSISHFQRWIEIYENDEDEQNLEAKYQIVMPQVFRGFIIHLLNQNLEP